MSNCSNGFIPSSRGLPEWVKKAWQATLKLSVGRQQKQRELVNRVMEHTTDGRLQITAGVVFFPCACLLQEQICGNESSQGQSFDEAPVHGEFNLTDEMFNKGLQDVMGEDRRARYSWTTLRSILLREAHRG